MTRPLVPFVKTITIMASLVVWQPHVDTIQPLENSGILTGRVTSTTNPVQALRVKARNTKERISYTVFTQDGRYQIFNLPSGPYTVSILEEAFTTQEQHVTLSPGETKTVDLTVSKRPDSNKVELVDFDALYPPGPTRDVLLQSCFPCHSSAGKGHLGRATSAWHRKGPRTEDEWRAAVNRMWNRPSGFPLISEAMVSPKQREDIIQYFTQHFGPDSKERDLKLDELVRDEEALAQALYVQYELPQGHNIHDAYPSHVTPGLVWLSGTLGAIVGVDTKNPDFQSRTKAWKIPSPADRVFVHGIIEDQGKVYWTEIAGDHIGELDPKTNKLNRYPVPTKGAWQHTLRADSNGNVWFSNFTSASLIGRFGADKSVVEFDALEGWEVKGWNGYGLTVDSQDRVWAVGLTTSGIGMYDPKNDLWKLYPMSSPARRLTVDSNGNVWACQFFNNTIAKIEPNTGEVTEYSLPLKYGSPYEVWADLEDNLWTTNDVYNSLVKFEQQNKEFTYVPYPNLDAHTPKLEVDIEGTLWFGMKIGSRWELTAFQQHGNVER